uniref:Thromboxane A2 receptor n=1 Tax=Lates calcarifer TaxID=8187 RepID=A0A4W6EJM7_LATCA
KWLSMHFGGYAPKMNRLISTMSANESSESGCRSEVRLDNSTCTQKELSVTPSVISMTVGIFSNSLALFILAKSYNRIRIKCRASFLLFASSLVVTDLLGHLISGSLVIFVYSSRKKWEMFDPHRIVCGVFGACLVFFGLSPLFLGSAMAVERCIGVTRPIFHSTVLAPHHMKRLLVITWLLPALVAVLPVLLQRPYEVQISRSFCFFHTEKPKDWLDVFLPLLFSMLGLLALLLSIVCNALTSCVLLQARLRRKHHCRGTSYHTEMICQLLAIMLVSCVCWGPLLSTTVVISESSCERCLTRATDEPTSLTLLTVVRMATWNQILDPWVYILLRRAVLRKIFKLSHCCWGSTSQDLRLPPPDTTIKSIT